MEEKVIIIIVAYLLNASKVFGKADLVNKYCNLYSEDTVKTCFVKETLVTLSHSPNQLAVDKLTNKLYFSIDSGKGDYVPSALNIDTKKMTIIKGIQDAFAIAYDSQEKIMYFGGSHGIYKYNPERQLLYHLNRDNLDIWWLTVNTHVYYIKFPSLNAYYYANRTIKPMRELIDVNVQQFVFDNDNNIFFINSTGLYGVTHRYSKHILLRDSPKFISIALDNNGIVYLCAEDGIFMISKLVQKVKKVVSIQGVLGLTFDRDNNIIYSDSHEIVRLLTVSLHNS